MAAVVWIVVPGLLASAVVLSVRKRRTGWVAACVTTLIVSWGLALLALSSAYSTVARVWVPNVSATGVLLTIGGSLAGLAFLLIGALGPSNRWDYRRHESRRARAAAVGGSNVEGEP